MSPRGHRFLRIAAVAALIALAMMLWPVFDSRPIPIVIAMSAGQALGTLSLLLYLAVVAAELRRARLIGRGRASEPPKEGG